MPRQAHLIRRALDYVGLAFLYRLEGGERDGEYVVASSITSSLQFMRKPGARGSMGAEVLDEAFSRLGALLKEDGARVRELLEQPEVVIFASDEHAFCGEFLYEAKGTADIEQAMRAFGYGVVHETYEPGARS